MTLRALLVDDEAAARRNLRALLRKYSGIAISGEAANAVEARRLIADLRPDVVFLDIQMPGESGFDLLASIENPPAIIFVTAYDRHAIRAFEINALDYLLKPIDPQRLTAALSRIPKPEAGAPGAPPDTTPGRLSGEDRILLDAGRRRYLFPVRDIEHIEADGEYSKVFLIATSEKFLIRRSLKTWMRMLPEALFCRIHRSIIVNLSHVRTIEGDETGMHLLGAKGGKPLPVSRRFAPALLCRLKR